VGYRSVELGKPIWILRDVRGTTASITGSFANAIEEAIEMLVVARDAAGNQTETTHAVMAT